MSRSCLRMAMTVVVAIVWVSSALAWQANGVFVGHARFTPNGSIFEHATLADEAGGIFCAWPDYSYADSGSAIVVQRMTKSGTRASGWPEAGRVLGLWRHAEVPRLVRDGLGGTFALWSDWDEVQGFWDIGAQRVTPDGNIALGWPEAGRMLGLHSVVEGFAAVEDGAGGFYLAWQDRSAADHIEVRVQRRTAHGNVAPGWPAQGLVLTTTAYFISPTIVPSAAGVIVVFADTRNADPTDIYAQRVLANGALAPNWPAGGFAVCKVAGGQYGLEAVPDGSGGAMVAWSDYRTGSNELYVHRITMAGASAAGWPESGRPVCDVSCGGGDVRLASDEEGGALLTWVDFEASYLHVYAQHIAANGAIATGWPGAAVELGVPASDRVEPAITADGTGRTLVAWIGDRTWPRDVLLQRLDAGGTPEAGWPMTGLPVCDDNTPQWSPQVIADGTGGAYVVWLDGRNDLGGSIDLYAQRIDPGGSTPVNVLEPGTVPVRLTVRPNPFATQTRVFASFGYATHGVVRVYDVAGRLVRMLAADGVIPASGLLWDGCNDHGVRLGPGVYVAEIVTPAQHLRSKVVLTR